MPSTVIRSFSYDALKHRLRVVFVSGMVYEYLNVPQEIYDEMRAAFSKGTYLNERIKGFYEFRKV
ncbi:KTSC domain-containing protein [Sediminibacterium roseum]|uniref:KTSC domain-containing protein n=1 Tax=Sediminibacterium roseum TaxID=1978412 RepID=A0ABW9ZV77_9BACT|nr:KTSC domain-containing protein [Sediminibacterium roseum]NCI50272.1 KTSC domain-containing protein [Sediminibacterium roseum]